MTERLFSLAALTVLELSPPEMVEVAARAGYDRVGLRLIPATPEEHHFPLVADAGLRQREFPLGRAKELVGVPRRQALRQRLRVGKRNVVRTGRGGPGENRRRADRPRRHERER